MYPNKPVTRILTLLLMLLLAACGGSASPDELDGTGWALTAFVDSQGDVPPIAGTTLTIAFAGGAASGSTGCNQYNATYTRTDSGLTFDAFAVTEMACQSPEAMEQEQRYLDIIQNVSSYSINNAGQLQLSTGDRRALIFTAQQ